MYCISPNKFTKIKVFCEQELDGGGWTVRIYISIKLIYQEKGSKKWRTTKKGKKKENLKMIGVYSVNQFPFLSNLAINKLQLTIYGLSNKHLLICIYCFNLF